MATRIAVFGVFRHVLLWLSVLGICAGLYITLNAALVRPKQTDLSLDGPQQRTSWNVSDRENCNRTCETGSEPKPSSQTLSTKPTTATPAFNLQESLSFKSGFLTIENSSQSQSTETDSKGTSSEWNREGDYANDTIASEETDHKSQKGKLLNQAETELTVNSAVWSVQNSSEATRIDIAALRESNQVVQRVLQASSSETSGNYAQGANTNVRNESTELWEEWPKQNYSQKMQMPEPILAGSLQPWNTSDISLLSAPSDPYLPLTAEVNFGDSMNLTCRPSIFGFSPQQAAQTFIPRRPFIGCCSFPHSFLSLENNTVNQACTSHFSDIMVGQSRKDERLGDVHYKVDWDYSATSKEMGDSEYAFGRCEMWSKEAVLRNKFNSTAASRARNITEELRKTLGAEAKVRPLGVYLLVFDSVSRLHFYRNFPHTIDYLNTYLNSTASNHSVFDFQVNNAQGENTAPNMISMLYGLDLTDIKDYLKGYNYGNQEYEFKFVESQKMSMWKEMERRGFVTLFGFDTVWDYLSQYTGRVIDTDHMISNFYHAARRIVDYDEFASVQHCIGCENAHYYAINYFADYNKNYKEYNRFGYIHITTGHEDTGTVIRTADDDLLHLLQRLFTETSQDEDIAVMIASDHGLHVGTWDRAYEGFIENQLPLHLLITNNALLQRLGPHTQRILRHNTQRLVSRWDWHLTFQHLSTVPYGRLLPDSALYQTWKRKSETPHAVSLLLEEIPDIRTCADVHIPLYYCSCLSFSEVPVSTWNFSQLVDVPIRYMNTHISATHSNELCHALSSNQILKVLEQVNDPISRYYKVRFSINESQNAIFDAVLWAKYEHSAPPPPSLIDNYSRASAQAIKAIQLQEVIRTDEYAGVCEQLAKAFGVRAPYCICQLPFAEAAFNSTTFTARVDEVLSRISILVPERNVNCVNACLSRNKVCAYWALPLLNDQHILQQTWRSNSTLRLRFLNSGEEQTFEKVNIVEWRREGAGVRMIQTYSEMGIGWIISQVPWNYELKCSDADAFSRQLCPCY